MNSSASLMDVGSCQIFGLVTMRTKPLAPNSESANGSDPCAVLVSHSA